MSLVLRYSPVEKMIRSHAEPHGVLVCIPRVDDVADLEYTWAIDPSYEPPNSIHVERAQIVGVRGSVIQTTINGTVEEVRERVTCLTVEEAIDAADDLTTLTVMLSYAQQSLIAVVEETVGVHVYEPVIACAQFCAEVRDAIAQRLANQQQPDQEDPS